MIVYSLLSIFIFTNFLFILSIVLKRNNIIDVFWGPLIFVSSFTLYFTNFEIHKNKNINLITILILIFLWAIRIFFHIGSRFIKEKEEDFRYKAWREKWKYFYLRSYLQIYLLQGFLAFIMSLSIYSVLFISYFQINFPKVNLTFLIIGFVISFFGLVFESIADLQLKKFIQLKKENKINESILKSGLWYYTRHPNYFGEITFWFGIFILSLPSLSIFSVIPFLLISFLILKVSGIPKLEKKNEGNKEWEEYTKITPAFFPKFF